MQLGGENFASSKNSFHFIKLKYNSKYIHSNHTSIFRPSIDSKRRKNNSYITFTIVGKRFHKLFKANQKKILSWEETNRRKLFMNLGLGIWLCWVLSFGRNFCCHWPQLVCNLSEAWSLWWFCWPASLHHWSPLQVTRFRHWWPQCIAHDTTWLVFQVNGQKRKSKFIEVEKQ